MIRIVDILKKAGAWKEESEPHEIKKGPTPQAPQVSISAAIQKEKLKTPLSGEETEKLLREIEGQIESILVKGESEAVQKFLAAVEKLVAEQQIDNPELLKKLSRLKYAPALETALHALKLGIDSSYSRQRLVELACAAIVDGIEPSPGRLRQIVGRSVSIESEEYKNIITLAEIYRQQKAPN